MKLTLGEICRLAGGDLEGDPDLPISGVGKIEEAREGELTFIANPKYLKYLGRTKASAVIVPRDAPPAPSHSLIRSDNPYFVFMKALILFNPPEALYGRGIHPAAIVGQNAKLGKDLSIGPHAVIGDGCSIGDGTVLGAGVFIGNGSSVGRECILHPHVSIREKVIIGDRVIIHNGAVIGSDGFGFVPEEGVYHKIPQVGTVVIEDDVEIGANVTIDRATLGETRIKKGAKLDNLIQVAHNCSVGEHTVIAAQTGMAGSTTIGNHVRIAGQAGFAGHMSVGDGAVVAAQAGVVKDVPPGEMVSGYPARPHREELRREAAGARMPEMLREIRALKKRLDELEERMRKSGC
ncbi:UDP-3-O-(3-hydroxymyristoyl)glucosamine N-acyltransferase [bacterium]|nr:UDP-3-O-(3-hydroxymyristoyl)glucosamine N-acyltransferase [bacterium]